MLGDFGTERPEVEESFRYFGNEVRVNPDLTDVAIINLFTSIDKTDGMAAVGEQLRHVGTVLVHPEDLDAFWLLFKQHRQTMEDLAELAAGILSAVTDRPTKLPSASSDGQPTTDTSSTEGFSSPALRVLEGRGRPDLAVAVLRAEQESLAG